MHTTFTYTPLDTKKSNLSKSIPCSLPTQYMVRPWHFKSSMPLFQCLWFLNWVFEIGQSVVNRPKEHGLALFQTFYSSMIRDAILTCARKPTWVGLIYSTETATKSLKQKNQKVTTDMLRSKINSQGNPFNQSWQWHISAANLNGDQLKTTPISLTTLIQSIYLSFNYAFQRKTVYLV